LIWIFIYPVFGFSHTSDLIAYRSFLVTENSGLIPNRDFDFPYGPFFLQLFGLANPLHSFNLWYLFLTLVDTWILKLILVNNKESSRDLFWFWLLNPLIIIITQVLGQNQILILLFSTLALISTSSKLFRVSILYSIGALLVKMIQFLYLPGFFVFLWKKNRKLIWLSMLPVLVYAVGGLSITSTWFNGVQHEFELLCPGNLSFWVAQLFPEISLKFLNFVSSICILIVVLYCIRNFQVNENLFFISSFVTLVAFLLTNPRSYSQYWIFTLPLVCFISDKVLQKKMIINLALISVLVPVETSFYFNFILEESFNKYLAWFGLVVLDFSILSIGFHSIFRMIRFQNIRSC
jgi:hypothetical protein